MVWLLFFLRTKPSGLYRHQRGLGLHRVGYREGDLTSESPSLPSTPRRVPSGHGTKSSILYLHSPTVRPEYIVLLFGYPLIQDSLSHALWLNNSWLIKSIWQMQVQCKCWIVLMNSMRIWRMYSNYDPSSRTSGSAHIIIKVSSHLSIFFATLK